MQFQHGTQIGAPTGSGVIGAQAVTSPPAVANGSGINLLTSSSPTYMTTLQGIMISWTGVTSAGQFNFQYGTGFGQTIIVFQTVGAGSIYVPCNSISLSNYGLHVANNSTGGSYTITIFYTLAST